MQYFTRSILYPILVSAGLTLGSTPSMAAASSSPQQVYAQYAVGVFKMVSGDYLGASDNLEYAWNSSSHNPTVGMTLARCYYALKDFTRAEMVVDDILGKSDANRAAWMLKAQMRYVERDRRSAALCLEKARKYGPPSLEIERLLGNVYYELGEADPAIAAYRRCLAIDTGLPFIQMRFGRLLASIGKWREAEAAFRSAWALDKNFTEPASELARLLLDTDRATEAVGVLRSIVEHDPDDDESLMTLVTVLNDAGKPGSAIAALEKRRSVRPLARDARLMLGKLYFDAKRYKQARDEFVLLYTSEPKRPEFARILAEVYLYLGDARRARKYYDRAIAVGPDDYHGYLGLYFASTPRFTSAPAQVKLDRGEAVHLIASAARLVASDDFDGNYLTGVAWLSVDSVQTATRALETCVVLRPGDRNARLNLASAYERLERYSDALPYVEALYKESPEEPTILNFYGYLLAEMNKDLDHAVGLVKRALQIDPDNGYFLDSLGWIYYRMGKYKNAIVALNRANERVADDPVILEHLGDAYRAMRRFSEARAAYERSNRLQGGNDSILEKIESTRSPQ